MGRNLAFDAQTKPSAVRLFGDPGLATSLRSALKNLGISTPSAASHGPGLDVFLARQRLDPCASRGAADAAALGRSFLLVALEWGAAALGPIIRAERRDPCVECCLVDLSAVRIDDRVLERAAPAELSPLPGLASAIAAQEIARFLETGESTLVGNQLHLTPYTDVGRVAPPVLLRVACSRRASCPRCGAASETGPGAEQTPWAWLPDPVKDPECEAEATRPLSSR